MIHTRPLGRSVPLVDSSLSRLRFHEQKRRGSGRTIKNRFLTTKYIVGEFLYE